MSTKSNDQGRAFEYITLITLKDEISRIRQADIIENSSFYAAKSAFDNIKDSQKKNLLLAAQAIIPVIFKLEPLICDNGNDTLQLSIQKDQSGITGDVRDILLVRRNIQWEIGLSMKHNHFAVKHSRLSPTIDFGQSWYGYPCSKTYNDQKDSIFNYIRGFKGKRWSELDKKEDNVYVPLLTAFRDEISRSYEIHKDIPSKLVEYLLGKFDFYKVVGIDREKLTEIQTFNLHGTLNKSSKTIKASIIIPKVILPTRIINFDFKPNSKNTLELYLDNGWQFSFRLHNAETLVKESLKFDIQIIGMPTTVMTLNCKWIIE